MHFFSEFVLLELGNESREQDSIYENLIHTIIENLGHLSLKRRTISTYKNSISQIVSPDCAKPRHVLPFIYILQNIRLAKPSH